MLTDSTSQPVIGFALQCAAAAACCHIPVINWGNLHTWRVETCALRKRSSLAALSSNRAPRVADQVAILFASGAHAGFDQLAEAAARLRTQFPSLQHVVGTAVRTSLLRLSSSALPSLFMRRHSCKRCFYRCKHHRQGGVRVEALLPALKCPVWIIAVIASPFVPSLHNVLAALTCAMCRGFTAEPPVPYP